MSVGYVITTLLEKECQYLSSIKIKNDEQDITFNQLAELKENVANHNKSTGVYQPELRKNSNSYLKNTVSNSLNQSIHICELYKLCEKTPQELVSILSKLPNEDIEDYLKEYSYSPDSLKLKIIEYCHCK